ncbi:hypothetical protein KAX75_04140, partial [candidate division WOR-3 bacterium]|nr:hypothetical protein [candidate division WOR-3 bacterium]
MNTQPEVRLKAVEIYIKSGDSLRRVSEKLSIPRLTLTRWVRWYKEGGTDNLKRRKPYKRPWNRPSRKIEENVMLLKERDPALTLIKAQKMLETEGIRMSMKGIWGIWKRYALTGRSKKNPYESFGPLTPEIKDSLRRIKEMLKDGRIKDASEIVNSLPSFPNDPILREIPEESLTPRRQLDRLSFFFGEIPFQDYYRKVKKIRKALEKKGLLYSSIFAGIGESFALSWMVTPQKNLKLINLLEEKTEGVRNSTFHFYLSYSKGNIHSRLLHFREAKACLRQCTNLVRFSPAPTFFTALGNFQIFIQDFRKASLYFRKTLEMEIDDNNRKDLLLRIALNQEIAGRYANSMRFLHYAEGNIERVRSIFAIIRAHCAFGLGDITKSLFLLKSALEESERGQLRNHLHLASLGLSAIQAALGKEKEAKIMLRKYLPLFRKYGMEREVLTNNILLRKNILVNEHIQGFPIFHLLSLLQDGKYRKALKCARNKELLGFFHRAIVFFPEPVWQLLESGKDTGLPRSILNLPVFKKDIPVYSVKFLGHLIVYRNQEYLKLNLRPKDTSFLIYIASSREKSISLDKIYRNFWPHNKKPSRNLAHLLVRIRRALKLPSHYLYIKEDSLCFDCYFTTDYGEYQEHIAQAKVLLRAGEWGFAKREYLSAFKLFRGEPFRKMYDDWSDDKRLEILFGYETEVLSFAKKLNSKERTEEAEKLLRRA